MFLPPDLRQNIFYTVYFTVTHNLPVFIYGAGIFVFAILALHKPRRSFILLLLGFIILLFSFEYEKHILEGLKEQTINALITIKEYGLVRRIINFVLVKALPLGMPIIGWILVLGGAYLNIKEDRAIKAK